MRKRNMTVKVAFHDFEMLFGNSYRDWDDQLLEFCCMSHPVRVPLKISGSAFRWVSYGGLTWCYPDKFQEQLDIEGQGRQAADFMWGNLPANEQSKFTKLARELSERHDRQQLAIPSFSQD